MPLRRILASLGLTLVLVPPALQAQSVVVDEGTFAITLAGKPAGKETFQIRRSGLGTDAVVLAQGHVQLDEPSGKLELGTLLEAGLPNGVATGYRLKVTGAETSELSLKLAGGIYVSLIRSKAGEEQREFMARPGTHILEKEVAHQYYFLHDVAGGARTPVIEPLTHRAFELTASAWTDEELHLGADVVQARRVTFTEGAGDKDARTVWYDRQGRVLKVEIPSLGYVAERQDLVG